MLLYPGQLYSIGWALALLNHASINLTITANTDSVSHAFPSLLPSDSAAKFDSLELWTGADLGDVVAGDSIGPVTVAPGQLSVVTLDPDC